MIKQKQAFTLVELIVVITIIAILWTIAFISLQWYSVSSRDSARISDLSTIKSSLELFSLDAWKYPNTTDWFNVTYSGWFIVWNQWTFWSQTTKNVHRLDKIPKDPLTGQEYTYSVNFNRSLYQIAWVKEWDDVSFNTFDRANAWDIITEPLIRWNYKWAIIKTLSGSNCKVLIAPSIITSTPSTVTDLSEIYATGWLVVSWYKNLPTSFNGTKFNTTGWFDFKPTDIEAYSDSDSCNPLYDPKSSSARDTMINNVALLYSWSIIENSSAVQDAIVETPSSDEFLVSTVVVNHLGWNIGNITTKSSSTGNESCTFDVSTFDNCVLP